MNWKPRLDSKPEWTRCPRNGVSYSSLGRTHQARAGCSNRSRGALVPSVRRGGAKTKNRHTPCFPYIYVTLLFSPCIYIYHHKNPHTPCFPIYVTLLFSPNTSPGVSSAPPLLSSRSHRRSSGRSSRTCSSGSSGSAHDFSWAPNQVGSLPNESTRLNELVECTRLLYSSKRTDSPESIDTPNSSTWRFHRFPE